MPKEDVLEELHAWLQENWDPELTVAQWWERLGLAGWSNPSLPPNAYGPFFDFWFTVRQRNVSKAGAVTIDYPSLPINRDTGMNFNTHSGHAPTVRYPLTGSIVSCSCFIVMSVPRSPGDSP